MKRFLSRMIREQGEAFMLKNNIWKGSEDSTGNVIDTSAHMTFSFVWYFINFAALLSTSHRKNCHWNYKYRGDPRVKLFLVSSKLKLDGMFPNVLENVQHSLSNDQIWQPWVRTCKASQGSGMSWTNGWSTCLRCTTLVLWSLWVRHLS